MNQAHIKFFATILLFSFFQSNYSMQYLTRTLPSITARSLRQQPKLYNIARRVKLHPKKTPHLKPILPSHTLLKSLYGLDQDTQAAYISNLNFSNLKALCACTKTKLGYIEELEAFPKASAFLALCKLFFPILTFSANSTSSTIFWGAATYWVYTKVDLFSDFEKCKLTQIKEQCTKALLTKHSPKPQQALYCCCQENNCSYKKA